MKDFEIKPTKDRGNGLFAKRDFAAGQIIFQFEGKFVTSTDIATKKIPSEITDSFLQIGPELYLDIKGHHSFFIQHHCVPNVFVKIIVNHAFGIAIHAIKANEELFFDYSLTSTDSPDSWAMPCTCGHKYACRKTISGFQSLPSEKKQIYIGKGMVPKYIVESMK
jgi:SET domain-containing protein